VHNIQNHLPRPVQASRVTLLPDRQPDAVDLMILPAGEMAVGPGVLIPQALIRPVASLMSSIKLITERASTTTKVLFQIHERYNASSHWGINE
jgi:hypothetical protein